MRKLVSGLLLAGAALAASGCTDAYEQRGLCSYFGACEYGLGEDLDNLNYCKELGSCDDGIDHTEWRPGGGKASKSAGSDSGSADAAGGGDDSQ